VVKVEKKAFMPPSGTGSLPKPNCLKHVPFDFMKITGSISVLFLIQPLEDFFARIALIQRVKKL